MYSVEYLKLRNKDTAYKKAIYIISWVINKYFLVLKKIKKMLITFCFQLNGYITSYFPIVIIRSLFKYNGFSIIIN